MTESSVRLLFSLGAVLTLMACGANPTTPSTPSEPPVTKLSGTITEAVGIPLVNAKVTIMPGTADERSTLTASNGKFLMFDVGGPQTVTISADGYQPVTRQITIEREFVLDVELQPLVPPVQIAGDWTARFEAAASCSGLPEAALVRTYRATVAQQGVAMTIQFSGPGLVGNTSFAGSIRGDRAKVELGNNWDVAGLSEQITEHQSVQFGGHLSLTTGASSMTGTLDGSVITGDPSNHWSDYLECDSASHRVTFRR